MGQIARLGLGIVGYALGGPIGGLVGSLLGGLLFPPEQKPTKVGPIKISAPQKGQPLTVLYGTRRQPGYYIWYGNFQAHAPQQGKGGKGLGAGSGRQDVTTYSASLALAICEGNEPPARPIQLLRIWAGKDVIWNSDGSVGSGLNFTFYAGQPGQAPDSEMAQFTQTAQTLGGSQGPVTTESFSASGSQSGGNPPTYVVTKPPIWPGTVLAYYNFTNPVSGLQEQHYLTPSATSPPSQGQFFVATGTGTVTLGDAPVELGGAGVWAGQTVFVQYQQAVGATVVAVGPLSYPHVCYIVFHSFPLGVQTSPPNFSFEVSRPFVFGASSAFAAHIHGAGVPDFNEFSVNDGTTIYGTTDGSAAGTVSMDAQNNVYKSFRGPSGNLWNVGISSDGGKTFTRLGNLFTDDSASLNQADNFIRTSNGTLLAFGYNIAGPADNKAIVWRSTDSGATWTKITFSSIAESTEVGSVIEDPSRPGNIWISYGGGNPPGHLWHSTDHGATWSPKSFADLGLGTLGGNGGVIRSIYARTNGTILVHVFQIGPGVNYIVRSTDGGATWSDILLSFTGAPQANGQTIAEVFTGTHLGRLVWLGYLFSDNDGVAWSALATSANGAGTPAINCAGATNGAIYASDVSNWYRSQNGGDSWTIIFSTTVNQIDQIATPLAGVAPSGPFDVNPVDVIQDFVTHTRYGLGRPQADIDAVTFAPTETYVGAQGLLSSPVLDKSQSGLKHIEEILALYDGFLFTSQGVIKFGVRQPAVATNVFAFGDYTAKELPAVTRPGIRDTKNNILIEWGDRAIDYNQAFAQLKYDDDIQATGERQDARSLLAVTTTAVAQALATRAFLGNSVRKLALTHGLDPRWGLLEPGDIYVAQAPGISALQVFRIAGIVEDEHWGLRIESIEDPICVAPTPVPTFNVQQPVPPLGPPGPGATANTIGYVVEVPYELSGGALRLAVFGVGSGTGWVGAEVFVSRDATTYVFAGALGRATAGLLRTPMLASPYQFDPQTVMMDPTQSGQTLPATTRDGLHAQSLLLALGVTPSTSSPPGPAANQLVEWLAYQDAVLQPSGIYSVDTFLRSLYDSQPSPAGASAPQWASGTSFLLFDPRAVAFVPFGVGDVGTPIYFKFVTHALFGSVFVTTAPTYLTYTPQGIALWPDPPSLVQVQRPDGVLVGGGNGF